VNRTLEAIEEIAHHVGSVSGAVQQTAAAVEEQSVTTDEVSRNMENAAAVTVQLQHSIGGIRGSSEELSRLASDLNSLVEWFKV
jgi:methyl-accepting chemotaxis protein